MDQQQPKQSSTVMSNQLDPFTLIQPSTMHINDLPDDCLRALLKQFETLQDLVAFAFVCPRWASVVQQLMRTRQDSLKVFDSDQNIELYQRCALMQYNLIKLDPNAGVKQTRDRQEDHILVQSLPRENIEDILVQLFVSVKSLVLHSRVVDHAKMIRGLNELTSITLLELPDLIVKQSQIWEALNQSSQLKYMHLLHANAINPFVVEKMNFLPRIQSLTLDNYWHSNVSAILNRLSSERCRCLQIGFLAKSEDKVMMKLVEENSELVANLTQLSVQLDNTTQDMIRKLILKLIVTHFKALTYLDLEFVSDGIVPSGIAKLNAQLPNLTEVRFAHRLCVKPHQPIPEQLPNIRKIYIANPIAECYFINSLFSSPGQAHGNIDPSDDLFQDIYPFMILNPKDKAEVCEMLANRHLFELSEMDEAILNDIDRSNQILMNRPHLFPELEQAIFVLNSSNLPEQYCEKFRTSIRNWVPVQHWHRCALFDTARGTLNQTFFGGDAQDLVDNPPVMLPPRRYLLELIDAGQDDGHDHDEEDEVEEEEEKVERIQYGTEYRIRIDNRPVKTKQFRTVLL